MNISSVRSVPFRRFKHAAHGCRQLLRVFTETERAYCAGRRNRDAHLAARFAAKEAVLKALGTGLGPGMRWTDVEIVNSPLGRPSVRLSGAALAAARRLGGGVALSLSHTGDYAIASAVLDRGAAGCVST